jgi:hypothetical protein
MLPENPTRQRLEVELQLALGRTLMATKGFGDAEADAAFGRAASLSRTLNDIELLTRARWGEALTGTEGLKDLSRIGEELLTLAQNNLGY